MKRTVRFTLNNRKFGSQTTVEGVHVGDDNSCELIITVTDGNKILDLSGKTTIATMCGTKPDGTIISRPCTIVDNNIVYTLEKQDTAVSGNVSYQVTVTTDDGISQSVIATAKFTVAVMKNIYIPIYRLLESEPSNWSTNYSSYYRLIDNKYTAITGNTCPAFLNDTFYYLVNPNYDSEDDYGAFQSALVRVENLIGRASDILTTLDNKINDIEAEHISNKVTDEIKITDNITNYPSIKYLLANYYKDNTVDDLLGKKANLPVIYEEESYDWLTGFRVTVAGTQVSDSNYQCTDVIDCKCGDSFRISSVVKISTAAISYIDVVWLDENKKVISYDVGSDKATNAIYKEKIITAPKGTSYVRFNRWKYYYDLHPDYYCIEKVVCKSIDLNAIQQQLSDIADLPAYFTNVRNAVNFGVKNNGESTELAPLFEALSDGTLIYFPSGTYLITDPYVLLSDLNNITIVMSRSAQIVIANSSEKGDTLIGFSNCTNVTLKNMNINGKHLINHGVYFTGCKDVEVDGGELQYIGNSKSTFSSGLRFSSCNDRVTINNVKIHHIYTGAFGDDGRGYSAGIAVNSTDDGYSQNMLISNCEIYTIRNSGDVVTDGDGIYLIQRPKTTDRMLSNIVIRDCRIYNCTLRCIKASCRGVTVDHCNLYNDGTGIITRGYLADFQFADSSTIVNSTLHNTYGGCVAVNYDTGVFIAENNTLIGNGVSNKGQGIALNRKLRDDDIYFEKATVIIKDNYISDVPRAILVNYETEGAYDYNSITIRDNVIGYFSNDAAITVDPRRVNSIASLIIDGLSFSTGGTKSEIIEQNNTYFGTEKSDLQIINLGDSSSFVNPTAILCIKNVVGSENDIWNDYNFSSAQIEMLKQQ